MFLLWEIAHLKGVLRRATLPPFTAGTGTAGQRCFSPWGKCFCDSPQNLFHRLSFAIHNDVFCSEKITPQRRFETNYVAPFHIWYRDRDAFSPWGKLFCDSPRVHPWGHSFLFAPLQTQHLIWICVLAISYWLSKKLAISNGGWFEIWRGKQDFPIVENVHVST